MATHKAARTGMLLAGWLVCAGSASVRSEHHPSPGLYTAIATLARVPPALCLSFPHCNKLQGP